VSDESDVKRVGGGDVGEGAVLVEARGDLFRPQLAPGQCAMDDRDTYAGHCEGLACERGVWEVVGAVVVGGEEKSSEVVEWFTMGRHLIGPTP
jgi:hypothetical protein